MAKMIELTCDQCKRLFSRKLSEYELCLARGMTQMFCSRACRKASTAWSDADLVYLKENYLGSTYEEIRRALGRTKLAVELKLKSLGLRKNQRWSSSERDYLEANVGRMTARAIAEALGRPKYSVDNARRQFGLAKPRATMDAVGLSTVLRLYKKGWTDAEIGENVGRDPSAIRQWRNRNGLKANGWTPRARARLSMLRRRDGRYRKYLDAFRLVEHAEAVAMGWPQARTLREAQILEMLSARGPLTKRTIGELLGTYTPTRHGHYVIGPLNRLVRRGLVLTLGWSPGWRRDRSRIYKIAEHVAKQDVGDYYRPNVEIDPEQYDPLVCKLALARGAPKGRVKESPQYDDGWVGLLKARERFRPELGYKFITFAYYYIDGHILRGITKRAARKGDGSLVAVVPFSQIGKGEDDDDASSMAVVEDRSGADAADQCDALLGRLDDRSQRLVRLVVMRGFTLDEAAAMERPPITGARVGQIVEAALVRMRDGQETIAT